MFRYVDGLRGGLGDGFSYGFSFFCCRRTFCYGGFVEESGCIFVRVVAGFRFIFVFRFFVFFFLCEVNRVLGLVVVVGLVYIRRIFIFLKGIKKNLKRVCG